ncbi:hypothetical protein GCM10011338_30000 [Alteromonas lipolytica]|nr:hypothetical protein GCM10011338_30000 [Alteromonas lipolytica]
MDGELDARYRDVSLKDAVRRAFMDMTLDGWVFMGVSRQCLSKIKGYPDVADSRGDVELNARYKKGLPFRIALFLRIGSLAVLTVVTDFVNNLTILESDISSIYRVTTTLSDFIRQSYQQLLSKAT